MKILTVKCDFHIGENHERDEVTFNAGDVSTPFNITIINDDVYEINETFYLTIDPGKWNLGNPDITEIIIVENEKCK